MSDYRLPEAVASVCFTGHRIFNEGEHATVRSRLEELLDALLEKNSSIVFYAGGAIGFDTQAALAVLRLRDRNPGRVKLRLILPCRGQEKSWSRLEKEIYAKIIEKADSHIFLSDHYFKGCMQLRNRELVDRAELCVAFMREGTESGGTAYTVRYAKKSGVPVINIADEEWSIEK